jgi:hypothetical protein
MKSQPDKLKEKTMKKTLLVVAALLSFVLVSGGRQDAPPAESAVGRYQILYNPNVRADTFLLDTQTGKVWTPTQFSQFKHVPTAWLIQDRIDNDAQLLDWSKRQTPQYEQPK